MYQVRFNVVSTTLHIGYFFLLSQFVVIRDLKMSHLFAPDTITATFFALLIALYVKVILLGGEAVEVSVIDTNLQKWYFIMYTAFAFLRQLNISNYN